ncbi:holo-ACP synthase [Fictibacillus phosphorivorans]|uniref:holo-ACP synthase n=1 Tax=Fictibacillus phosphorivorans TaxID=1221500 RepID=UPI00203E1AD6|nr:holo-ACP synthase [Fictibacillus phosphorivorans]MCM3719390.1 holo-ACP synthase [Fictibacillus phosphorivorans]MCM3777132.1 holo-ACP synthase [Fictibacillus phosphorivorans]
MIVGTGIDIIELKRIREAALHQERFSNRILTPFEQKKFDSLKGNRKYEYLAGRFAAKEAMAKALGIGIGRELSWQDMEIKSDEKGKPFITSPYPYLCHLSISHTREYAVAQVILESSSS